MGGAHPSTLSWSTVGTEAVTLLPDDLLGTAVLDLLEAGKKKDDYHRDADYKISKGTSTDSGYDTDEDANMIITSVRGGALDGIMAMSGAKAAAMGLPGRAAVNRPLVVRPRSGGRTT